DLPVADVDAYIAARPGMVADPDTSLHFPRYYEHLVDLHSTAPVSMRLFRREEDKISVQSQDGAVTVELSDLSHYFLLWQIERNRSLEFLRAFYESSFGG